MTRDQIYEIWRTPASPWTAWVKPVLFSYMHLQEIVSSFAARQWPISFACCVAIIVDLPGREAVEVGIALARCGYRPIPIYNASPFPIQESVDTAIIFRTDEIERLSSPVVIDLVPVISALCDAANELDAAKLPSFAPPAFLLDSRRSGNGRAPDMGWYDNRSFVTAGDFPSAEFFKARGISTVVIVQRGEELQPDLLDVLLKLQTDGVTITLQLPWESWKPLNVSVHRPVLVRRLWWWFQRRLGYRTNPWGYFGAFLRRGGGG